MTTRHDPADRVSPIRRFISFPLTRILIAVILINVATFAMRALAESLMYLLRVHNTSFAVLVVFVVRILAVYFAYTLFVRYIERREPSEMALGKRAITELVWGGLLGLATITVVMGFVYTFGDYAVVGMNPWGVLLPGSTYHLFFAFLQDVIYFAVVFRISEERLGTWIAIAITSLIFGFKHLLFPEQTIWSAICIACEAGIWFSALYIITRRIWLIVGFHSVWNFTQYGILGVPHRDIASLLQAEFSGPTAVTGGSAGLDGSIVTFLICTTVGLYFVRRAWQKGGFIRPFWNQQREREAPLLRPTAQQ